MLYILCNFSSCISDMCLFYKDFFVVFTLKNRAAWLKRKPGYNSYVSKLSAAGSEMTPYMGAQAKQMAFQQPAKKLSGFLLYLMVCKVCCPQNRHGKSLFLPADTFIIAPVQAFNKDKPFKINKLHKMALNHAIPVPHGSLPAHDTVAQGERCGDTSFPLQTE